MTEDKRIYPINACQWQSTPCGIFWQCIQCKYYGHNIIWTPHIQHTPSLNCLVDATELWAPERPDTETVSFPKQCISWTRDIKRRTHTTLLYIIYSSHILIFISICTFHTCTYIIVYIVFLIFCILLFYYLCPIQLLSLCCTVALLSLNQIPCMRKHTWQ